MKVYRITVITHDACMAANFGGSVACYTRTFDLPEEVQAYIASQINPYSLVTFGLDSDSSAAFAAEERQQ